MKRVAPGAAENSVTLSDAIFQLLPAGHPAVVLDGPREALSTQVAWSSGLTRAQALDQVAANYGLNVLFTGTKPGSRLLITKAASSEAPAAAETPLLVVTQARPQTPAPASAFVPTPAPIVTKTTVVVAAAPAMAPAPVHSPALRNFEVRLNDMRLSTSMSRWAAENGVRIRWDADKQVLISAPQTFQAGSILEAIAMALATPGIRNGEYPLEACEYPNTPRLIRVTRLGEQAKDCPFP